MRHRLSDDQVPRRFLRRMMHVATWHSFFTRLVDNESLDLMSDSVPFVGCYGTIDAVFEPIRARLSDGLLPDPRELP